MIIPSIDLMGGQAVQLVQGARLELEAGDPRPLADKFGKVGEVAVIDLDAALGRGDNTELITELLDRAPCRVGGGIRDAKTAISWLDAGARKVILGTAATPEVLHELPRDRVIAALDTRDDEVVVKGWTETTSTRVEDRIEELRELVSGFLITFVESEGGLGGLPRDRVRALAKLCGSSRLTVAGGVRHPSDIAMADRAGADAQVGMALYKELFDLAEGFCAPLSTDRDDGLWPTVVSNQRGETLGLVYSNLESVRAALDSGKGVYHSRSRGGLWRKGATSGAEQELIAIDTDCDRDALRFTIRQLGTGFCHTGTEGCFGNLTGLSALERTVRERLQTAPEGSYTRRLMADPGLLRSKLLEEAEELDDAECQAEAAHEAADVIYFAMVAAMRRGASLADIESELDCRARRVTRRPGNAKDKERRA